jgi:HEAT repeat protein
MRMSLLPFVLAVSLISASNERAAAQTPDMPRFNGKTVHQLVSLLKHKDPDIRCEAASELGRRSSEIRKVTAALIDALSDADKNVRSAAVMSLACMGPPATDALLRALNDPAADVRWSAVRALKFRRESGSWAPVDALLPALTRTLKDKDDLVRCASVEALGQLGKAATPLLIDALKSNDASMRLAAARAFSETESVRRSAIRPLVDALEDQNEEVRLFAAKALARIGPKAAEAVPALVELLRHQPEPGVDQYDDLFPVIEVALSRMGAAAVPGLVGCLRDRNVAVRLCAADALGRIGPVAEAAVPHLVSRLRDRESMVRASAARALGSIGPQTEAVLTALLARLKDADRNVRVQASCALGKLRLEPHRVVLDLIEVLKDPEADVRASVVQAIGRLGPAATAAIPALMESLRDSDCTVRIRSAWALGDLGPAAKIAFPALLDARNRRPDLEQEAIAEALKRIDPWAAKQAGVP